MFCGPGLVRYGGHPVADSGASVAADGSATTATEVFPPESYAPSSARPQAPDGCSFPKAGAG